MAFPSPSCTPAEATDPGSSRSWGGGGTALSTDLGFRAPRIERRGPGPLVFARVPELGDEVEVALHIAER